MLLRQKSSGFSLVEIMIGISLVVVISVFVGATVVQFSSVRAQILDDANKAYLAEEGYEIIRLLRDADWSNINSLTTDTFHYLEVSTTTLAISSAPEMVENKYNRSFLLRDVYRNGSGEIVASTTAGASVDSDIKKVLVYVGDDNSTTTYQALLANFPTP